jgi:hypothetical protein
MIRRRNKEINDFMADVNKEEQTLGIRNAVLAASALRRALASRSLVPDACCGKKEGASALSAHLGQAGWLRRGRWFFASQSLVPAETALRWALVRPCASSLDEAARECMRACADASLLTRHCLCLCKCYSRQPAPMRLVYARASATAASIKRDTSKKACTRFLSGWEFRAKP